MKLKTNSKKILLSLLAAAILFVSPIAAPTAAKTAVPALPFGVGPRGNFDIDPANGIYVSPKGDDSSATGSAGKPYKSINAALETAKPGGTVILRGGTYSEGVNVRIRKPNITIKSAKGEWAVIDLTKHDIGHDQDSGVYFDVGSSGGRLQGVEVIGGFYAVCVETTFRWDPDDPFTYGASDIIIEDCVLHDSKYDVVKVKPGCSNITIRHNEIYNSGRAEAGKPYWLYGEANAEGIDNVNGHKMTVQNNHIHDIGGTGIYAKGGAADVLIESNFIERIYGAGIMVGFDTSPEWFDTMANPKYYENIRGVVRNNLIVGTGWEGIGLYGSKDAQIYNNTLVDVDNGPGKYHSAIYFGLTYQDWESYAGRPANVNPNIHHNIISQPAAFMRPMIEIRYDDNDQLGPLSALEGNPVMNDNCYYIAGKKASFDDRRPQSELKNANLSAWQAHIGGEGSIEADPELDARYMPANPQCAGMGINSLAPSPILNFKKTKTYRSGLFSDVNENDWYGQNKEKSVATVYEYGLMQGSGADTFKPNGDITIAEAVAIAARIHDIYNGGTGEFAARGGEWYQVYADYAEGKNIIDAGTFPDYAKSATRAEMAYIFSRSVPQGELAAVNTVKSLPDVNGGTKYHAEIIALYEAGVLTGSDDKGTFNPNGSITRAEAAAVIARIILPKSRAGGKVFG